MDYTNKWAYTSPVAFWVIDVWPSNQLDLLVTVSQYRSEGQAADRKVHEVFIHIT